MTQIPAPPLPIDQERAVQTITAIYREAETMVDRHWQRSIENLPDQGRDDRHDLQRSLLLLDATGVDITPLTEAWQANWEAYNRNGGTLEFVPIKPTWREL